MSAFNAITDTVLDHYLKASPTDWIAAQKEALELIYAIGAQDSFSPRHMVRGALSVALAR